jgi:hypothetical protein
MQISGFPISSNKEKILATSIVMGLFLGGACNIFAGISDE